MFDFASYSIPKNIESQVDFGHSLLLKRIDGIIEIYYSGIKYDVEHLIEIDKHLRSYSSNNKLLVLNHTSPNTSITSAGRDYLAKDNRTDFIKAYAVFIQSISQKILAHFFLHINKPKFATCFFSPKEIEAAEKWLKQFENQTE